MVRIIPMASSIKPSFSSLGFSGSGRVGVALSSPNLCRRVSVFHLASGVFPLFLFFLFNICTFSLLVFFAFVWVCILLEPDAFFSFFLWG